MRFWFWRYSLLLLASCPTLGSSAQVGKKSIIDVEVTESTFRKLGTTRPLRDLAGDFRPSGSKKAAHEVENFKGRIIFGAPGEHDLPRGKDPLFSEIRTRGGGLRLDPDLVVEGMAQIDVGESVPDVNGAVSPNYFVQGVNATFILVFDKDGNRLGNPIDLDDLWSEIGEASNGDIIVLYDASAGRYFVSEFAPADRMLMAISDTEDPAGTWTVFSMDTPFFPDYPKFSIWDNSYVLTTNEFEDDGQLVFYVLNRASMLAGDQDVQMQRMTLPNGAEFLNFLALTPVEWIGQNSPSPETRPMVMHITDDAWGVSPFDQIELFEISIDWENADKTLVEKTVLQTAPFDTDFCAELEPGTFSCVPQPGQGGIDGVPYLIMNKAQYRNFGTHSSIVLNFAVDVTGDQQAGIRWMELRKTGAGDWTIYQQGTHGSIGDEHFFMGAISIDSDGNIGLGYAASGNSTFPSLRYTGRRAGDRLGIMSVEEVYVGEGTNNSSVHRHGDYFSMAIDANDQFWLTGQYTNSTRRWETSIAAFTFPTFGADIGPLNVLAPLDGPDLSNETVRVSVRNYGSQTVQNFEIGFMFDGGGSMVETVTNATLVPGGVYEHTFASQIQFGAQGQYPLTVFTRLQGDQNTLNDDCDYIISKRTRNDVHLVELNGLSAIMCSQPVEIEVVFENKGLSPLQEMTIEYRINNVLIDSGFWLGALGTGQQESVIHYLSGFSTGQNEVRVDLVSPNGDSDENPADNDVSEVVQFFEREIVVLELLTDAFPEETIWELLDSNDDVLYSDGPLDDENTSFRYEFCLETDGCYTFVVNDSYCDGMNWAGMPGDYTIRTIDGVLLAELDDPDFGCSTSSEFCVSPVCAINAVVSVAHESEPDAGNGVVRIEASGGTAPYAYSIDGGLSFQQSQIFNFTPPGTYRGVARDDEGCLGGQSFVVKACDTRMSLEIEDATSESNADGSVVVTSDAGTGAMYSIDGGEFTDSPVFADLLPGGYAFAVRNEDGCIVSQYGIVGVSTSIGYLEDGTLVKVYPNPSSGIFNIVLEETSSPYMNYDILDATGRLIMSKTASNYSGDIRGFFNLRDYAAGMYLVRLRDSGASQLIKVFKF